MATEEATIRAESPEMRASRYVSSAAKNWVRPSFLRVGIKEDTEEKQLEGGLFRLILIERESAAKGKLPFKDSDKLLLCAIEGRARSFIGACNQITVVFEGDILPFILIHGRADRGFIEKRPSFGNKAIVGVATGSGNFGVAELANRRIIVRLVVRVFCEIILLNNAQKMESDLSVNIPAKINERTESSSVFGRHRGRYAGMNTERLIGVHMHLRLSVAGNVGMLSAAVMVREAELHILTPRVNIPFGAAIADVNHPCRVRSAIKKSFLLPSVEIGNQVCWHRFRWIFDAGHVTHTVFHRHFPGSVLTPHIARICHIGILMSGNAPLI